MAEARQQFVEGMKREAFDRVVKLLEITDQVIVDVERHTGLPWESLSLELRLRSLADLYASMMGDQGSSKATSA